ncbi:MAG: hypothetical protein EOP61_10575 [Sphingomonadales bacterium]|nr:MAG: hypothetical protein EOP61_10575 [Sphingomonadales bacterium]
MPLLIAAIAFLVAPPFAEPQWYRVNSGKQTIAYVEGLGIAKDGDLRTTSMATIRSAASMDGSLMFVTKLTFNCATGEVSEHKVTYLDEQGNVLRSGDPIAGTAFHSIFEGTNIDFARRFVCAGEGGTRVDDPVADSRIAFGMQ